MRKKTLTINCNGCNSCQVNDSNQFVCDWGKGNKIMEPAKGKKTISCKLKR